MKTEMRVLTVVCSLCILSCSDDTGFNAGQGEKPLKEVEVIQGPPQEAKESDQIAKQPETPAEPDKVGAVEEVDAVLVEDSAIGLKAQTFSYGEPDPKVDYLFVVDNSVSMLNIINLVDSGFQNILDKQVFSPNSQVAVMSTMNGDPEDFNVTGIGISRYSGIDFEPGFLDFVNQDAILNYRLESPQNADKWLMDGCKNKWFKPNDKDGMGNYCLTAALQSTYSAVGAEAGILAYEQLLLKNADEPVFRQGSLVNVIFVSDTHHPGRNVQELIDSTKTFQELKQLTEQANEVAGLKFHAIAPAEKCTGERLYDRSYYTLVDASQGTNGDSCTLTDYSNFMETMVKASQEAESVFALEKPATKIYQVRVNDEVITEYELSDEADEIRINGLDPKEPVEITVIYSV